MEGEPRFVPDVPQPTLTVPTPRPTFASPLRSQPAEVTMNWTRILPDLYLGSCPQSLHDLDTREELGIGVVVNLQLDTDMIEHSLPWPELERHYQARRFTAIRVEMNDQEPWSVTQGLSDAVSALHEALNDGWAVYLHCTSGVNRAPTVAIAYLAASHGGMDLGESTSYVTTRRACLPFVDAIETWMFD